MKHREFILTPLSTLIERALLPMDLYKEQVSNYVMKEYVLQTVFLQLTGCMEQKAKCIFWDIATHDFEFRRIFLDKGNKELGNLGEYSTYNSKNTVYKELIKQTKSGKEERKKGIDTDKKIKILEQLVSFKDDILEKSIIKMWLPRELQELNIKELFETKRWGKDSLFNSPLNDKIYESLYEHRNRCAHHTLSFQGNVMDPLRIFMTVENSNHASYASWFTLLVLMDLIYIELYKEFCGKYN